MRNFFHRVNNAIARFMYGRNGSDQLNLALLTLYLLIWVLEVLFARYSAVSAVLGTVSLALTVVVLFRMFSKDLNKRRAENQRFLAWWYPLKGRFAGTRQRRQDKAHRYFACKACKTVCRVPAGKGRIEITCPKCGKSFIVKS